MNPALGLLEFGSVAAGILAGDAMVKRGPVMSVHAGTVHPGKYLVMVSGEVAAVEEALTAGRENSGGSIVDEVFLQDVHRSVVEAIAGRRRPSVGESLGVVETATVSATIEAADAGVKGASVALLEVHLADGLGGKAYVLFSGELQDVEAAVAVASERVDASMLVGSVVVARLDSGMAENLRADSRFAAQVWRYADAAG